MNNLSWLLYLADVLPNLANVAVITLTAVGCFGTIGIVAWFIDYADEKSRNDAKGLPTTAPKPPIKTYILTLLISGFIFIFTPSKETIYLIAGSEAGEAVVTSNEGKEILNDIKEVIKHQLNNLKG